MNTKSTKKNAKKREKRRMEFLNKGEVKEEQEEIQLKDPVTLSKEQLSEAKKMDETTLNALKKSVECMICLEPQVNPKHLPCHHSFCKDCLDDILHFNVDGSATLRCPLHCKGMVIISKGVTTNCLPNNYTLQGVLDVLKGFDKMTQILTCQEAKECTNIVSHSCSICSHKTCANCWDKHSCIKKYFVFVTFDVKENCFLPLCQEHQSTAKLICFDCNERFVCTYCIHRNHKNHETEPLDKYTPGIRNHLLSLLKVNKEYIEQSNVSYDNEVIKIKSFRKQLENELNVRMIKQLSRYMAQLNLKKDILLEDFDDHVATYKKHVTYANMPGNNIVGAISAYSDKVSNKQDFEILLEMKSIVLNIERLSSIHCFKAHLTDICNNKYVLGDLNLKSFEISCSSDRSNNNVKVTDLQIKDIHNNIWQGIEKDMNDMKEFVTNLDSTLQKTIANPTREVWTKRYLFEEVGEMIINDKIEELIMILKLHPNIIHTKNKLKHTLLHISSSYGKIEALTLLLKINDEHVNDENTSGVTALMLTSHYGHTLCAELLLKHNADVDLQKKDGCTALLLASWYGQLACLDLLLNYNADADMKNKDGSTALMISSQNGHVLCVKVLLEHNVDINIQNKKGQNAYAVSTTNEIRAMIIKHVNSQGL